MVKLEALADRPPTKDAEEYDEAGYVCDCVPSTPGAGRTHNMIANSESLPNEAVKLAGLQGRCLVLGEDSYRRDAGPEPGWARSLRKVPRSRYAFRATGIVLLIAAVSACAPTQPRQGAAQPAWATQPALFTDIDHVILAIDSLERGITLLREATGLTASFGGTHPGRGTQNALLGLGPGVYLELLAPNPQDAAGAAQVADFAGFRALTPAGWAVRTSNADSLRARLIGRGLPGGSVRAGSRERPDGATLRWRTFDPWPAVAEPLPFFIEWDPAGPHPSADAPPGCRLAALTLASPAADSVRTLFGHVPIEVPVTLAPRDAMGLTLECPKGRVSFPARGP